MKNKVVAPFVGVALGLLLVAIGVGLLLVPESVPEVREGVDVSRYRDTVNNKEFFLFSHPKADIYGVNAQDSDKKPNFVGETNRELPYNVGDFTVEDGTISAVLRKEGYEDLPVVFTMKSVKRAMVPAEEEPLFVLKPKSLWKHRLQLRPYAGVYALIGILAVCLGAIPASSQVRRLRALEAAKENNVTNDKLVGSTYRDYDVLELLGQGGQGKVYLVAPSKGLMFRQYALKFSKRTAPELQRELEDPSLSDDHRERTEQLLNMALDDDKRFDREMSTLSTKFDHPNVVKPIEYGSEETSHWVVMPYLGKTSLADRLKQGPLRKDEVLSVFGDIVAGLQAVHDQGVVHRDLKPENVMLHEGKAVLIDFGLVKGKDDKTFTTPGAVMGSTQYIAPEQLTFQESQNEKTDQFSLGAMLFFSICCSYPYPADGIHSLMQRTSAEYDSLLKHDPDQKPEVNDVLQKMMAKMQADRFANVDEAFKAFVKAYKA